MPDLQTTLHTDMLERCKKRRRSLPQRLYRAIRTELSSTRQLYGLEWGDPELVPPLNYIKDRWVLPYVRPDQTAVEIGPGGGRWTRYLLGFQQLYVVDYYDELLSELRRNFSRPNMRFVKNSGTDFPGIPEGAVDFIFSFGCFVHLDTPIVESYLSNIRGILKPGGNAVIHYSDKTKVMAREPIGFAENTPDQMREMVTAAGFQVLQEDLTSMWHSALIRFTQ
jgi:SAM-dependent methyltransferase